MRSASPEQATGASPGQAAGKSAYPERAASASPEQAAAIVAALERFMRETSPRGGNTADECPDPWVRAAILEGVMREDPELVFPSPG